MTVLAIVTTVGHRDDARRLATTLVERRLVACAQIEPIESIYRWQGAVQQEPEFRLTLKTTTARAAAVEAALRELHPYELPDIHAVVPERVDPRYAEWVQAQTSTPASDPAAA